MDAIEIFTALSTPAGRTDPYPLYAALHEKGEAVEIGPADVMVVGYDAINSVLRDPGFRVSDGSNFDQDFPSWRENPVFIQGADWILNLNGPRHTRIRGLLARLFTARRIAGLEPAIAKMADELLDAMADRGADGSAVEFMHDFAYLLPVTVICELIGIPEADREGFRPLYATWPTFSSLTTCQPWLRSTPRRSSCSRTSRPWPAGGAPILATTCSATCSRSATPTMAG